MTLDRTIATSAGSGATRRHATPGAALIDRAAPNVPLLEASAVADLAAPDLARVAASAGSDVAGPQRPKRQAQDLANGIGTYPGGKNGAGVYQQLINQMPPHEEFIEAFLGSGALIRRKRPAPADNVGIDIDHGVIAEHVASRSRGYRVLHADARLWLRAHRWQRGALVYADPPYLGTARSRPTRAVYTCEMLGREEHEELLRILTSLPALVMISGYASELYDRALASWRRLEFMGQTRGGPRTEVVWMNYPEPLELHDYRYIGDDFRERTRIARKIARWRRKLAALPALERAAVISGIGVTAAK